MDLKAIASRATSLLIQTSEEDSHIDMNSPDAKRAINELESSEAKERKLDQLIRQGKIKSVNDIVNDTHGPNLDDISVDHTVPAIDENGIVNFDAVYSAAGIPTVQFSSEQAIEMLANIGAQGNIESQRATIRTILATMGKAVGANPDEIVADASRKIKAIDSFVEAGAAQFAELESANNKKIEELKKQIAEREALAQKAKKQREEVYDQCHKKVSDLDNLLTFFAIDTTKQN